MASHTAYLTFETPERRAFVRITDEVQDAVAESGVREGLVLVSAMHITAGVWVNDDEPGLLEDADVLHHAEPAHGEPLLELAERLPVAVEEQVEEAATRRVGQGLEHRVVVLGHPPRLRDHLVTCQEADRDEPVSGRSRPMVGAPTRRGLLAV